jgi:hypothetical protein
VNGICSRRGEYLAKAADCLVCHIASGGADYAGGLAFPLPFGTLYSTNITADKDTGIGNYTDQEFLDAVQRGIRKDGARLYPAMRTYTVEQVIVAAHAYGPSKLLHHMQHKGRLTGLSNQLGQRARTNSEQLLVINVSMIIVAGSLMVVAYLALGALLQLLVHDLPTGLGLAGFIVAPAFGFLGVGFPILAMNAFSMAGARSCRCAGTWRCCRLRCGRAHGPPNSIIARADHAGHDDDGPRVAAAGGGNLTGMQRQVGIYSWHLYRPDSQAEKPADLPVQQSTKVDDNQPQDR